MKIKSFRGQIADGGIDTIRLHTNTGSIGYRIVKFMVMPVKAGSTEFESTVKVFKIVQTTATEDVDFQDNTLLAAGYTENRASSDYIGLPLITFFDNEIFNQDIYLTHIDTLSSQACNYYIELEQMSLALDENTVATLKDIRNIKEATP